MTPALEDIIDTFASVDDELRIELLLDYAKKLPPIPERLREERDAGVNRVHECMTPVFLWIEPEGEVVRIHVDVAEEAPTVKGILSIVVRACDGASAEDVANLPLDLLNRMRLSGLIRMNRAVGLNAILNRIRKRGAELAGRPTPRART